MTDTVAAVYSQHRFLIWNNHLLTVLLLKIWSVLNSHQWTPVDRPLTWPLFDSIKPHLKRSWWNKATLQYEAALISYFLLVCLKYFDIARDFNGAWYEAVRMPVADGLVVARFHGVCVLGLDCRGGVARPGRCFWAKIHVMVVKSVV